MNAIGYAILVFVISNLILAWLTGFSEKEEAIQAEVRISFLLAISVLLIMWGK